jgi:hypothetical protein
MATTARKLAKPKVMPAVTADDIAKYHSTPDRCDCPDAGFRGGSWPTPLGNRCKHSASLIFGTVQGLVAPALAAAPEFSDVPATLEQDARLEPPTLPAEPVALTGIDAEVVTYKTTARGCNCADWGFAQFTDSPEPCVHIRHAQAQAQAAIPAPAEPAPVAEAIAPAPVAAEAISADVAAPTISLDRLVMGMMATGKFRSTESAAKLALAEAERAEKAGMGLMPWLKAHFLDQCWLPADLTHLPMVDVTGSHCGCSPYASSNHKCQHIRAYRAGILDGSYLFEGHLLGARDWLRELAPTPAAITELAEAVAEGSDIPAADLLPYARQEMARRAAVAAEPAPEWVGGPAEAAPFAASDKVVQMPWIQEQRERKSPPVDLTFGRELLAAMDAGLVLPVLNLAEVPLDALPALAEAAQEPFIDDFTPADDSEDWRYHADPVNGDGYWIPAEADILGFPQAG